MIDIETLLESDGLLRTSFEGGYSFTYRLLTLKEYRIFRGLRDGKVLDPMIVASKVFEHCLVGNSALVSNDLPAGIEVSIGNLILYLSGDCENQTLKQDLMSARSNYPADSVNEYMKRIVATAFPAYRWEEFEQFSRKKLIEMFTISEAILKNRLGDQYKPLDPKEIKSQGEIQAETKQKIDFARENATLKKSLGAWAGEDAREYEAQSTSLNQSQIRELKQKQHR